MSWIRTLQATGIFCVGLVSSAVAQERPATNPFEGNPAAIKTGQGLFRARCVTCHGVDGRGVRGPDISGLWAGGRTDGGIFDTVRSGVPGTEMPASPVLYIPDEEIWMTVAYLRTLNAMAPPAVHGGDAENGERIFSARCASCHRVNGRGGRIGPDLSRAGASRGRNALVNQIRGANEDIAPGFEPVTLTTPEGRTIRGVKKNEDVFSVQIMDTRERIQGYLRTELKDVRDETRSLMPKFGLDILNERDLDDLLAYLSRLTGTNEVVR
jgi:putative heme-binding domain-containing protein